MISEIERRLTVSNFIS